MAHGAISGDPGLGTQVSVTLRGSLDRDSPEGHPDETERELGIGGLVEGLFLPFLPLPLPLSLSLSLSLMSPPLVYAAALTLQQTPLGQRLRQKRRKSTHTAVEGGSWGSRPPPCGCK